MKYTVLLFSVALLSFSSCEKKVEPITGITSNIALKPVNANTSDSKNAPGKKIAIGDAVPAMSQLGRGDFTELGLRDAFEKATGFSLPNSVLPKTGSYVVWNEKDYGGKNRSNHNATFVVPSNEVLALASAIEAKWRTTHGADPDVRIYRSSGGEHGFVVNGMQFLPGTFALQINNPYASYSELSIQLHLDPKSGNIALTSYRGTQDNPSSHLDEEMERRQEERDAKAQIEADAKWSKNPASK
jgi:hypothetical protein